ncbi:MAG: rod shape-determining protein RodA [Flavobacteriales bacterium]|nr:rod shape-determining protein RodA [Flavobacteriales bacterium]
MSQRDSIWRNMDKPLVLMYLLLMAMGWANIYSAAYDPEHANLFDRAREYGAQSVWIVASLLIGAAMLLVRGEFIRNLAYPVYAFVLLLLVLVLLVGREVNGAKAWFGVGGFGIQPAEFSKFATSLALSSYLSGLKTLKEARSRVVAATLILLPVGLIMLQPDTGTALVSAAFVLVLYREGLSGNILLIAILAAILVVLSLIMKESVYSIPFTGTEVHGQYFLIFLLAVFCLLIFLFVRKFVLKHRRKRIYVYLLAVLLGSAAFISSVDHLVDRMPAHQQTRIRVLLGLEYDPRGFGYNVEQSKTAIGSGGLLGKGFLNGTFTKYKYVPMQSTDFIFCTVGEEWGFVGSAVVVLLFGALILRCIQISDRQRSRFTRIYAYCVASIFFLHLMINVGMAIGLAPVIGIPLPFFSYGGSSLIGFTILLAILVRLDAERLEVLR